MIRWREGRVVRVRSRWQGAVELDVDLVADGGGWQSCKALAYPALVGSPGPGDRVLLNTLALERELGTGGYALVIALPDRLPESGGAPSGGLREPPGHLVKARYTPQQTMVLGVDEQDSPDHEVLREADDLVGMPVVVADLHSAVPAIVAGIRADAPQARVAYVMTDGGALPAWFSRTIAGLREAGWITACITAGQAFGGDLEAVSVHSALLAAQHVLQADVTIVAQGPGNLGTGTRWGFSGVAAGEAVNATGVLGGDPIASLRVSGADPRERHRGISHHSLTAYGRAALVSATIPLPRLAQVPGLEALGEAIGAQARALAAPLGRHRLVEVDLDGLPAALKQSPVRLSTMGRSLADDPAAFLSAAAAGRHAASLVRLPRG